MVTWPSPLLFPSPTSWARGGFVGSVWVFGVVHEVWTADARLHSKLFNDHKHWTPPLPFRARASGGGGRAVPRLHRNPNNSNKHWTPPLPFRARGSGGGGRLTAAALLALLLLLTACGDPAARQGHVRPCALPFFFEGSADLEEVALVGDFNGWNKDANPLVDTNGDGLFKAAFELPPGLQTYRLWDGAATHLDPYNPLTLYGAKDREESVVDVPDCDQPALEVERADTSPVGALVAQLTFWRGRANAPLESVDAILMPIGFHPLVTVDDEEHVTVFAYNLPAGKYWLKVAAGDTQGGRVERRFAFWIEPEPFDWRDAVFYQILIDRFRRGGGALDDMASIAEYQGGDLWGVVEAIESGYFEDLGVNALWLSPVDENPEGKFGKSEAVMAEAYHGYWPSEPRTVETRFGGEAALDAVVAAAHQRGLRVLMDAVPNHVHLEHPYWQEHSKDDWFAHPDGDCSCGVTCSWATDLQECWFDPFLPDLNWKNQAVVEQLIDDTVWWLERFDLDGARIDAVPMMPRLAVRHLRAQVRERIGAGGLETYLIGETYSRPGQQGTIRYYLGPDTLSGQFDFPTMWRLRDCLAGRLPMTDLASELAASEAAWEGTGAVMGVFLGNHDVARFLSDVNGDAVDDPRGSPPDAPAEGEDRAYALAKMAWTFVLTQAGAPVIFYGDEVGLPGATDPDNRRPMRFGDALAPREADLLAHVERLAALRRCSKALRRGVRETLWVDSQVFAYSRTTSAGEAALVVLNRSTAAKNLTLRVPTSWEEVMSLHSTQGETVTSLGGLVQVELAPRSAEAWLSEDCTQ